MVSWEYLWPTLRCRREVGVSPLLSIGWWYLSSVSPKRHSCRVSAANKGWRVYLLDPHPDAVAQYSGCTPGKRRAWFLPDDRHTASLVGLRGGWRHARMKFFTRTYGSNAVVPGCVISEPDLLTTPEAEILEGFSDQGVTQVRRITFKKDNTNISTKRLILTFNSPKLQSTIKAGYLNCKIRPYIPNTLRCFKCQRFGHSQTSYRGQLTCSRYASAGHSSTECTLKPKCTNCLQSHALDSKLCPKRKLEKQIQEIKTNKNISYSEARKLIVPQPSQTYDQITKPTAISTTTQTDPNITNIICPPLQYLKPVSSENPMPSISSSVSTVSTSSSSTQENLLPSPSAIIPTIQSESLLKISIPITTTTTSPVNNLNTSDSSLETETRSLTTNKFAALSTETQPLVPLPESVPTTYNSEHSNALKIPQYTKRNSRNRRKRPKVQKLEIEIKMAPHRPRKSAAIEYTTDEEDMITYDAEEEDFEPDPAVNSHLIL
ncbi:uncharacterized protein TNCV_83561 [Trichonephila clavipes]|nr:uncharacterized protein TNCV_83561 [Trichonephila clavipes]